VPLDSFNIILFSKGLTKSIVCKVSHLSFRDFHSPQTLCFPPHNIKNN